MTGIFLLLIFVSHAIAFSPSEKVTEKSYLESIDRAQSLFGPYIAISGNILHIEKNWSTDSSISSASYERPPVYLIKLSGGAFRTKTMTNDGLAFTICHEINHFIGGEPKYSPGYWPSVEGQADYMASNACLKSFWEGEDHKDSIAQMEIPRAISEICGQEALCIRSVMAGYVFAENYRQFKLTSVEYGKKYPPISFSKRDPLVVRETNRSYSSPQCRFDSALAGALCEKGKMFDVRDWRDPGELVCDEGLGQRPGCWFLSK